MHECHSPAWVCESVSISQACTSGETQAGRSALGLVAFFHVDFEIACNSSMSFFHRELATGRKSLTTLRASPGDRVPINLFYNN
jgi:hypothetical protein